MVASTKGRTVTPRKNRKKTQPVDPARLSLESVDLFEGLTESHRRRIESVCGWETFSKRAKIIDADDSDRDVYFIVEGRVQVERRSASGYSVTIAERGSGSYFGELAAIDGKRRSATVIALETTLLARLNKGVFIDYLRNTPEAAFAVMKHMSHNLRMDSERILELSETLRNLRTRSKPRKSSARKSAVKTTGRPPVKKTAVRKTAAKKPAVK